MCSFPPGAGRWPTLASLLWPLALMEGAVVGEVLVGKTWCSQGPDATSRAVGSVPTTAASSCTGQVGLGSTVTPPIPQGCHLIHACLVLLALPFPLHLGCCVFCRLTRSLHLALLEKMAAWKGVGMMDKGTCAAEASRYPGLPDQLAQC